MKIDISKLDEWLLYNKDYSQRGTTTQKHMEAMIKNTHEKAQKYQLTIKDLMKTAKE